MPRGARKRLCGITDRAVAPGRFDTLLKGLNMLRWALIFLVVAIIAGVLGFGGIAGDASAIARILFFVFIVVFLVSLAFRLISGRNLPSP